MSQQTNTPPPDYAQPKYRIPAPPADYTKSRYIPIPRIFYGCSTFAVLAVLILLLSTGLMRGVAATQQLWALAHPPLTVIPPLQINHDISCPLAPKPQSDTSPSLQFCSPIYVGNVAGPFGAHIVLIGTNLSEQPKKWWVTKEQDDATACLKRRTPRYCTALPPPTTRQTNKQGRGNKQTLTILFSWTWDDHFPRESGYSYIISTSVANQPVTTPKETDFTLLSSQPPCILIDKPPAKDDPACTQGSIVPLSSGSEHTLFGANWLLGWDQNLDDANMLNIHITVAATCAPWSSGTCATPVLFSDTVKVGEIGRDGTFKHLIKIPNNQSGTYIVQAVNKTPTQTQRLSISENVLNTVADQALTLDSDSKNPLLIINIK